MPNAANSAEVARRLVASAPEGVTVTDRHRDLAVLAVQGPSSDETLSALGLPVGHDYMTFQVATHDGVPVTVCRTGYTGERGYELIVDSAHAVAAVGRPARGRSGVRRAAVRPGCARHAAHRDGLPPARAGHLARHQPRRGAPGLGRRLEEAGLLGP